MRGGAALGRVEDCFTMALPYDPEQVPVGARRDLLDRVPEGGVVLDVGCWSGFAGRYLQRRRGATVDGIEPHAGMGERAAMAYRHVHATTVEAALTGDLLLEGTYDAILLLDVLEHLVDPAGVLRAATSKLRPGGVVLASIPNTAHWTMRKQLLLGRWDYADSGLMDRTHLRFFTIRTIRTLFAEAGLEVWSETYALDQPPIVRLPPARLRRLSRWPGLFAVQVLVEARVPAAGPATDRPDHP